MAVSTATSHRRRGGYVEAAAGYEEAELTTPSAVGEERRRIIKAGGRISSLLSMQISRRHAIRRYL